MIEVLEPGLLSTVQDGGRRGYGHLGVPLAGAADPLGLRIANLLLGNPAEAPALEITFTGARLRFETEMRIALAGGYVEALLDDVPVAMYQTVPVNPGSVLCTGPLRTGVRVYVAVAGGIALPPVLGSASTDTLGGLGPAPLTRGVRLPLGESGQTEQFHYWRAPPAFGEIAELRVLPGPQDDWFTAAACDALYSADFQVTERGDRTGVVLDGPLLTRAREGELPSSGMVTGAVQVPGDGRPILLLSNHGATGGYPVIATVISADRWRLGQLRTGTRLRFRAVSHEQARAALAEQERYLAESLVVADAALLEARALMMFARAHPELRAARLQNPARRLALRRG